MKLFVYFHTVVMVFFIFLLGGLGSDGCYYGPPGSAPRFPKECGADGLYIEH